MTSVLGVFHAGRRIGSLESTSSERLVFRYDSDWLSAADRFAISASLPLQRDPHETEAARWFFANLLPEGGAREAIARRLGLSVTNDFALLRALGGDCAGALMLIDGSLEPEASTGGYEPLSIEQLEGMAKRGSVMSAIDPRRGIRISLAGAQDKLPVLCSSHGAAPAFSLPRGASASTHILKFPNRSFKHLPANELLSNKIAGDLGLNVCESSLVRTPSTFLLLVKRYDRASDGPRIVRLHQEDMCQALGLPASRKYQDEGGPSLADCIRILTDTVIDPAQDTLALIRWIVFCALLGNADGHAKNLSILRVERGWQLAPFYDLVCTSLYPQHDTKLAMRVGSGNEPGNLNASHWRALATDCKIGARLVLDTVREMTDRIEAVTDARITWFRETYGESAVLQMLPRAIRRNARRIRLLLSE